MLNTLKKDILDNFNLKFINIDSFTIGYNNSKYEIEINIGTISDVKFFNICIITYDKIIENYYYANKSKCYEIIKKYFNKEIRKNKLKNIIC